MVHKNMLQSHACSMHASPLPPTVTAAVVWKLGVSIARHSGLVHVAV